MLFEPAVCEDLDFHAAILELFTESIEQVVSMLSAVLLYFFAAFIQNFFHFRRPLLAVSVGVKSVREDVPACYMGCLVR